MIRNKIYSVMGISILVASLFLSIWSYATHNKVVFVRNQVLLDGFDGMKDAQQRFNTKFKEQQSMFDSLKLSYNATEYSYRSTGDKKYEEILNAKKNQILQFNNYYKSITDQEDKKMTEQVLNQVNSYVREYGEKNKIDLIIGTTSSGNLMYGNPKLDVTDELLIYINQRYSGKK